VGVSPFWIITSVTVGGNLFGIPGLILGVPVVVLLKTVLEGSMEMRLIEKDKEVQKGNAPTERKIQRLFRKKEVSTLIKKCNDFGAGGVSVAIGELADGLNINLDLVPKKYDGLDGTELAISESQERMALVVSKEDADKFNKYAKEENLESTVVAEVTDDRRLKMTWRGRTILDISRDFLDTNGVKQKTNARIKEPVNSKYKRSFKSNI
jgi:phosphoribosylformylglycinamidine synthase